MKFEAGIIAPDALESDGWLSCKTEDRAVEPPSALGVELMLSTDEGNVILRDIIEHGEGWEKIRNYLQFLVLLNTLIYTF